MGTSDGKVPFGLGTLTKGGGGRGQKEVVRAQPEGDFRGGGVDGVGGPKSSKLGQQKFTKLGRDSRNFRQRVAEEAKAHTGRASIKKCVGEGSSHGGGTRLEAGSQCTRFSWAFPRKGIDWGKDERMPVRVRNNCCEKKVSNSQPKEGKGDQFRKKRKGIAHKEPPICN